MNYAIVENNTIVNVVVADPEFAAQQGWVACENAGIGWSLVDGKFVDTRPPLISEPEVQE